MDASESRTVQSMASDNEDDYLSDKFLLESVAVAPPPQKPLTYAERRKQAQRESEIKNAQNRLKKRREREEEAREEGLRQSLFERAEVEKQELGAENKAMKMMLRMGFKLGESLGRSEGGGSSTSNAEAGSSAGGAVPAPVTPDAMRSRSTTPAAAASETSQEETRTGHRTAPLPVDVWSGKKGVGLGKRAPSPSAVEHAVKTARLSEEAEKETYRSRTREAFEERRAIGRLTGATRTLLELDEKAGIQFNILALNPQEPETFPPELLEALSGSADAIENLKTVVSLGAQQQTESERLRKQMAMDALQPLDTHSPDGDGDGDGGGSEVPKKSDALPLSLSEQTVEEAREFLQLGGRDRLARVLHYLREKYCYCYWCGTQYDDKQDLDGNCPGEEEEAHD